MSKHKRFWQGISLALTSGVLLMIGLLWAMVSCQKEDLPPGPQIIAVDYEADSQDSLDWQSEAAQNARIAAGPKARLTIQYLNNESELFRPVTYTVRLWSFGNGEPASADRSAIDALGDEKYDNPDVRITKKQTHLAYTRRTVPAGWYLAEYETSGVFYKVNAMAGSDGLLVFNEHDFDAPLLSGYYSAYGRIKFTFGQQTATKAQAFMNLSKDQALERFWLYAEDATDKTKSVSWFMPPGTYVADWVKAGTDAHKTGTVTIAPGKRYPNLKL